MLAQSNDTGVRVPPENAGTRDCHWATKKHWCTCCLVFQRVLQENWSMYDSTSVCVEGGIVSYRTHYRSEN